jgi:hypothetical protein
MKATGYRGLARRALAKKKARHTMVEEMTEMADIRPAIQRASDRATPINLMSSVGT